MTALVIADHDNRSIKPATLSAVTAASQCGGDVHVLVAGWNAADAAAAAAKVPGVSKVLLADAPCLADGVAETVAEQVLAIASDYTHILASATAYGKNILPRVAATLDVAQLSVSGSFSTPNRESIASEGQAWPRLAVLTACAPTR